MGDVLLRFIDELHTTDCAARLPPGQPIAELTMRALLGFGTGQTAHHEIIDSSVDMELPLLDDVALHPSSEEECRNERPHPRDQPHTSSGTAERTNPMASDRRCQYATSCWSCRRPAAVNR